MPIRGWRWYCWIGQWYVPIVYKYKLLYLALVGHNLWVVMQVLTMGLWAHRLGEGVVIEGWRWVPWVLSSMVVTSYRLPLVTIGLSLIVITVLQLVADIQMELVWQKAALCTKSVSAVKNRKFCNWISGSCCFFGCCTSNSIDNRTKIQCSIAKVIITEEMFSLIWRQKNYQKLISYCIILSLCNCTSSVLFGSKI